MKDLKTIKFPGLEDVYKIPEGGSGGTGQDGKDGITPTIGENGNWYLGDEDTGKPSRGATGPQGATGPAGQDGAPGKDGVTPDIKIGTVTTLPAGSEATASMGGTAEQPMLNLGIPKGGTDASLGITGATPGQIAKITAVDTDGKPTAWEPVEMAGGGEWEKIADIELRADTALYVLADFAVWRKAKVIMRRPTYVSGLNKNVWCRVETKNDDTVTAYSCGYLSMEYGFVYWDFSAEVSNNVISSTTLRNNNIIKAETVMSTQTLTPINLPPTDYVFTLTFTDTSVIQDGDKVTVIGVRR